MRLLDQVVQTSSPFCVRTPDRIELVRLFGAMDLAPMIEETPLRFVCERDVSRVCADVAEDIDILRRCLDLVRMPAAQMWLEWDDAKFGVSNAGVLMGEGEGLRRAGMLVQSNATGRAGSMHICWNAPEANGDVDVAPVIVHFDLDDAGFRTGGGEDCVDLGQLDTGAALLNYLRFQVRPDWLSYYRDQAPKGGLSHILHACAAPFALDFNYLVSVCLLLNADMGPLRHRAVQRCAINQRRAALGKAALLDHVELYSALGRRPDREGQGFYETTQKRMHVVRGHLVRRGHNVFWRKPHWRGSPDAGMIATRTVTLRRLA